ncbi:MAG TPA: hypothetical protein VHQ90_24130 [Thermoanaerobaculia bacterium]|nr:hypothetical protein [Thermoanaerobaculia bacterium]
MPILVLNSLRDTSLWKLLDNSLSQQEGELARTLALNLLGICHDAAQRMKAFPTLHSEFTLHDDTHLLRVTELIYRLLPSAGELLNPVEIALLILAAHFHDQGMIPAPEEIQGFQTDSAFNLFRENWILSHPNLADLRQRLREGHLVGPDHARAIILERELDAALLTDYIRQSHGQRSSDLVRSFVTDPRWAVCGTSLAQFVARLCLSHVRPARDLTATNGFRHDEVIGTYRINMPYLGLLVRLADILDLDRDRTPDSLYRSLHFRSPVSLAEWAKHRAVEGWIIGPSLIQFTMRCEHPEYQRAAYHFMDAIDRELAEAHALCRMFPASFQKYALDLPQVVDRSRIEPKDAAYIYKDLEFSLSRDEIVKLLMTDNLYGRPYLAVRELLQNALDALRHRSALYRSHGQTCDPGKVSMVHELDEAGYEVLRCTDNGTGMDRTTIERFLTRAGRSYYRSPEFEQERIGFRAAGVDFDPCAQFGIGFMSVFMLGDQIALSTRRDFGPGHAYGEPLLVEINGLGGIVVFRPGPEDQLVGTSVTISGRRKPVFLDKYEDKVSLLAVLEGYALATEFPISGECRIPELRGEVHIPPEITVRETDLEARAIPYITTLEVGFGSLHPSLSGDLRGSFLVDNCGVPVLATGDAYWQPIPEPDPTGTKRPVLVTRTETTTDERVLSEAICLDGILVAGDLGRTSTEHSTLGSGGNPAPCGEHINYILDVRGLLKPPVTPSRYPPVHFFEPSAGWERISYLIARAQGILFEQLAMRFGEHVNPEVFWPLALIYGGTSRSGATSVGWMSSGSVWTSVPVPVGYLDGTSRWMLCSELGPLEAVVIAPESPANWSTLELRLEDGGTVGRCPELAGWIARGLPSVVSCVTDLVVSMATVASAEGRPRLELRAPQQVHCPPFESRSLLQTPPFNLRLLPYSQAAENLLSAELPFWTANRDHPLAKIFRDARWRQQKSGIEEFAGAMIRRLADSAPLDSLSHQRWQKRIGYMYQALDWCEVPSDAHPPYLRLRRTGEIEAISESTLDTWRRS